MLETGWMLWNNEDGENLMMGFARRYWRACWSLAASGIARAEEVLKAKIGVLRLSSSAPVFIAQDKGYFRDAGLDIELKFFDAAQPIAVATASGDVDFGITAFTAGLYNLAGKGTLKVIGGMSREKAGYPLIGYFASNNAYAAGLKTPRDLAGKRVAVTQTGSSFHYSLGLLADKYGFRLADVKVLPLQSLSNAAAALKGETVDAALLPASTARKLIDDGGAKLSGLGRRRDAVATGRGVRLAQNGGQQTAGDKTSWRACSRRPRISRRDPGQSLPAARRRSTTRQNRCWRSSRNTPTCRSSRWSATAPISTPTASSTSRMSATRSNGCRRRVLSTRDSVPATSSPRNM